MPCPFSTCWEVCICAFSNQPFPFFSTFIKLISFFILSKLFQKPKSYLQKYQLFQEPCTSSTKLCKLLLLQLCVVVLVAVLVVASKLVVVVKNDAVNNHSPHCSPRICSQALALCTDLQVMRSCHLLLLHYFCKP